MAQSNQVDDGITFDLGGRSAVWRMPSIVHRIEAIERVHAGSLAAAKAYSLVAGLPDSHLRGLGCPTPRVVAAAVYADKIGALGERALLDYMLASAKAFTCISRWYVETTKIAEARGNSEPDHADGSVEEPGQTSETRMDSAVSVEAS